MKRRSFFGTSAVAAAGMGISPGHSHSMSSNKAYEYVLTVAQSKRIIGKGVANHPLIAEALDNGTIIICTGTTNTYVAEEILGEKIESFAYSIGVTLPPSPYPPVKSVSRFEDIIIRKGKRESKGETVADAFKTMDVGDIIIKGGNALNYDKKVAGCLIGHPAGGTSGSFWGYLYGRKARLIIPIGLEKEISADIVTTSVSHIGYGSGNALMPLHGDIMTEIEAIQILTGASTYQIAAGGVRGAEGSIRLVSYGSGIEIEKVENLVSTTMNETPY